MAGKKRQRIAQLNSTAALLHAPIREHAMTGGENYRRERQRQRPKDNPAEQEKRRRNERRRYRPKQTASAKANRLNSAIKNDKRRILSRIKRKHLRRRPPPPCARNIDEHKRKAAEATDWLQAFNRSVFSFIFKRIFAFPCKQDIWNQRQRHKKQTPAVKP